jgi:bla regulator protein BlaR1
VLAQAAPAIPAPPPVPAAPAVAPAPAPAPAAAAAPSPRPARKQRVVIVSKDGKSETYTGADADKYIAEHGLPMPPHPPRLAIAPRPGEPPRVMLRQFHTMKDKDGKERRWVMPVVPEIISGNCAGDLKRPTTERSMKNGRERIVICTNRIEALSRNAERLALDSDLMERHAMISARSGLAMARAAIERNRALSEESRREALEGIAQAEAELKDQAKD